eukprot:TRINITY_DN33220_c0_g1_i1.p1 TRINITY_DN33220_c0_g1~~TRINITY_DN33220_c0_g1_i1.p1  ORF type:complete len:168 (+),score=42.35 TRINITY_DN33220_c0_g1_i1:71-505(+)
MVWHIDVGTDLFGEKLNTRFEFPRHPGLALLLQVSEAHFDRRQQALRPPTVSHVPAFASEIAMVYDDLFRRWVQLIGSEQLTHGGQVWLFQPESLLHGEARGVVPLPSYEAESGASHLPRRAPASSAIAGGMFPDPLARRYGYL